MTRKALFTVIISLFVFFGLGMFLGTKLKTKSSAPANQENTYQAGWDAAKKQLEKKGVGILPAGMEIKSINGTIDTISGDVLTLKNASSLNLLSDPELDTRTIQITANTKFYQLIQKDISRFQAEMTEYQKKIQEQAIATNPIAQSITPPQPQEKKEITSADLKVGQSISITSDDNIGEKKEFTAKEIMLQAIQPVPIESAGQPIASPASPKPTSTPATDTPTPVPPMPVNSSTPPAPTTTVAPPAPVPPIK